MKYMGNCPNCGGELKGVSIGWKCEKCGGLVDMHGGWHEAVNEPFIPDSVLKEQDEAIGGKYRRAIERIGKFGELFVEYEGDPRGPVGRVGNMRIEDEAQLMPVITDVDGGKWRPVQEEILQDLLKQLDYWKEQSFKACYEKKELSERAEKAEKQLREAKKCVSGLSFILKAIDGKMVMDKVLPIARSRLEEYREKYPSKKVVLDCKEEE